MLFRSVLIYETEVLDGNYISNKFVIVDHGFGISEEFLPHIFDPFAREKEKEISQEQGTGLGLAIAKKIIELMHGTIKIESHKGIGTKVLIEIRNKQIKEYREQDTRMEFQKYLKGIPVLVCDDVPMNVDIAKGILTHVGCVVETAENGMECHESH